MCLPSLEAEEEEASSKVFGNLFYEFVIGICAVVCFCMLGLSKKIHRITKEKDSVLVKKWHSSITNHLYWSATSSKSGVEKVAKWTSIVNHIQNIHKHSNAAFPRCSHPPKVSRARGKWFKAGM